MDEDFNIPEDDSGAGDNPILEVDQEKEIGDEGLIKKLLKVGQGSDTPNVGDEVHVHFLERCSMVRSLNLAEQPLSISCLDERKLLKVWVMV